MQAYLAALADGDATPATTTEPPNLSTFMASLSSAWHAGEVRPTFSVEAKPRYLRSLQKIAVAAPATKPTEAEIITLERTQWIVEADIKGFFDNVHTNT